MGRKIRTRKIYYYEEETDVAVDKKKVAYLLFLLLITGVMLATSTYAWFTTNRIVKVETLNVKVQSEGSLEISVDGINWKAGIDQDELVAARATYPGSVNQLPLMIEPISTIGALDNRGYMNMYLGEVRSNDSGDYILTSTKSTETESSGETSDGKFVAFDIFLKTTEAKDLYLTGKSNITYNGTTSVGTENAVRVAFIVEGNTDAGSSTSVIQSLSTTNQDNVYIWEPNYNTHTKTGISNAKDIYNITTSETNAQYISYDGVQAEISEGENITLKESLASKYPAKFSTVTPKIMTPTGSTTYQKLINLASGITKVRVYFWLEGQDVDCENNASVGDLAFTLEFSTNPS